MEYLRRILGLGFWFAHGLYPGIVICLVQGSFHQDALNVGFRDCRGWSVLKSLCRRSRGIVLISEMHNGHLKSLRGLNIHGFPETSLNPRILRRQKHDYTTGLLGKTLGFREACIYSTMPTIPDLGKFKGAKSLRSVSEVRNDAILLCTQLAEQSADPSWIQEGFGLGVKRLRGEKDWV